MIGLHRLEGHLLREKKGEKGKEAHMERSSTVSGGRGNRMVDQKRGYPGNIAKVFFHVMSQVLQLQFATTEGYGTVTPPYPNYKTNTVEGISAGRGRAKQLSNLEIRGKNKDRRRLTQTDAASPSGWRTPEEGTPTL